MANEAAVPRHAPLSIVRHPVSSILLPVPVLCFVGALVTDLSYLGSDGVLFWLDASSWLLLTGVIFGVIAGIVLLVDGFRGLGWAHVLVFAAAWLVELVNMFVHNRDGWTAVAGLGLILSIVGAVLVLIAGWLHRPAVELVR